MLRFSQSDRNLFHLESIAPPVGHYKLAGDLLNKKGKSFGKRSDSRNVRMENAPGPGHYFKPVKRSPIEPVKGELYKHSNRENNISSIPSIPARDSYVYQDVGNGIIVSVRMPPIRQIPPQSKGALLRRITPPRRVILHEQNNNSKVEEVQEEIGLVWGSAMLPTRQQHPLQPFEGEKNEPYHNQSTKMDSDVSREITNLQHQSVLLNELEDSVLDGSLSIERLGEISRLAYGKMQPGPGQYTIASAFEKKQKGAVWGRCTRFAEQQEATPEDSPGPAAYQLNSPLANHCAVLGHANRFDHDGAGNIPGPGSYKLPSLIKQGRQKLELQYGSVFGSGTKRFYSVQPTNATPGPASYQTVQLNRKKKKRNVFELKIPEELMTSKEPEDDLAWQQQNLTKPQCYLPPAKLHNTSSFSSVPRFRPTDDPTDGYLGPGYYDLKPQRENFNRKHNFFGRAHR